MAFIENTTILVAIYGAILSSIALTWNIISYLADKPKISPRYSTGLLDLSGSGNNLQHIFSLIFSNPTKHRVVVSSAGISFKNKQNLHFIGGNNGLPKVILQGDSHTIYRDIDIIKEAIDEQGATNYVWVRDATGKIYKGSIKKMVGNVEAMYKVKHDKTKSSNPST